MEFWDEYTYNALVITMFNGDIYVFYSDLKVFTLKNTMNKFFEKRNTSVNGFESIHEKESYSDIKEINKYTYVTENIELLAQKLDSAFEMV